MLPLFAAAALACAAVAPLTHADDADALLALHDIAGPSLSPDGSAVAFQVQRSDVDTNSYSSTWCLVSPNGGDARAVGDGGDIALPRLGAMGRRTGVWSTLSARWSPSGDYIAYLARRADGVGLEWCARDGSGCTRRVFEGDVEDLVWNADGSGFVAQIAYPRARASAEEEAEAAGGVRFDSRFDVYYSLAPVRPATPRPSRLVFFDHRAGIVREVNQIERAHFETTRRPATLVSIGTSRALTAYAATRVAPPTLPAGRVARHFERLGASGAVWTEPSHPTDAGSVPPLRLHARSAGDAAAQVCTARACEGRIVEFSPSRDGRFVVFIKREGWADSQHGLYLWNLHSGRVRRLMLTDDAVRVCEAGRDAVICLHEGPISPSRLVAIDFSGRIRVLHDPNPNWPTAQAAPARKLQWRGGDGRPLFGWLVRPARARGAPAPPLVVVQYRASGFLRGGVGDEYPVQAFAQRGMAVLVLDRPDPLELLAREANSDEIDRAEWRDLTERRRTLDALQTGIAHVAGLGEADPARVGVTGLSDGAETALFALIHCRCAAAFAVSGGFHDPISLYLNDERSRRDMRQDGRGEIGFGEGSVWATLSPALNAGQIRTPVLAQVADRELLFAVQSERLLRAAGAPFDLYVFENEYHVKWQPRHRAAIYARNLDWFSFWLMGEEDPDPGKQEAYARWREWRASANLEP